MQHLKCHEFKMCMFLMSCKAIMLYLASKIHHEQKYDLFGILTRAPCSGLRTKRRHLNKTCKSVDMLLFEGINRLLYGKKMMNLIKAVK